MATFLGIRFRGFVGWAGGGRTGCGPRGGSLGAGCGVGDERQDALAHRFEQRPVSGRFQQHAPGRGRDLRGGLERFQNWCSATMRIPSSHFPVPVFPVIILHFLCPGREDDRNNGDRKMKRGQKSKALHTNCENALEKTVNDAQCPRPGPHHPSFHRPRFPNPLLIQSSPPVCVPVKCDPSPVRTGGVSFCRLVNNPR